MPHRTPVFIDRSGRRWQRIRRAAIVLGVITTAIGLTLGLSLLFAPSIPELHPQSLTRKPIVRLSERARLAARHRFQQALATTKRVPPARHVNRIPSVPSNGQKQAAAGSPVVGGFYVNWDDNSYASLAANLKDLDVVVLEWGFVAGGGDSLRLDTLNGKRAMSRILQEPVEKRPRLLVMVSNFDSTKQEFGTSELRSLLTRPAARARAIAQLTQVVQANGLAGVLVDFEAAANFPHLHELSMTFSRELAAALHPLDKSIAYATPSYATNAELREIASTVDQVFAMLFDEHYSSGEPGPIASQQFYADRARAIASIVPREKLTLMIGAYGYDWNDRTGKITADEATFQDVMRDARDSGAVVRFDKTSLNSVATFQSPDSTDHDIWFLDAVTAYNQLKVAQSLGVAGVAFWRLGSEDPSVWRVLDEDGRLQSAQNLTTVSPGYDPEIDGQGEILRIRAQPVSGTRAITVDSTSGLITAEQYTNYPTPFIVQRFGAQEIHPHWVALTFDDGPDANWTGPILDTLASRGVKATFFVIGENADAHLPLLRRTYREGHEIGNHTYSHPNLGLTGRKRTEVELDANERLIEAMLDHRTALFRPPYFGDAEPTTLNELVPVWLATQRNYITVGLHVDSEDWQDPPPAQIIKNVLENRPEDPGDRAECADSLGRRSLGTGTTRACNIVLLHDGGGNRANTLAALGPLIDSLRARGDTLVLVSQLAGLTRDEAMPPLGGRAGMERLLLIGGFGLLGIVEWLLFWIFTIAVVLGVARLVVIGALAFIQRLLRHQDRSRPTTYAPGVSVVIPAYNEEKVISQTIDSILAQQYDGPMEIIVVDDGSRDATYQQARASHGDQPRVRIFEKPNGGKASALNFGIAHSLHDVIVALDADTLFARDTVAELVQPLADARVAAVAGNAKVGNRINLVTRWQALEYVTSQNLDRRAFSLLDCITVVPGAVGAWRREVVLKVGGFREDTLAEDQDLTLAVRRAGYSVAYADGAIALTEAPDTLRTLARQRFRWSFGTLQCAWKHRGTLFRRRYGTLGWVAMPNVWLFQLLLPALSPLADLMFVFSLLSVWASRTSHGATYALVNLEQVLTYYAVFLLVDWAAAMIAFLMEPREDKQLTWLIFIQRFAYRQIMYWVVVKSFAAAIRGHVVGWGKLERKATVELEAMGAGGSA
ncbi:MAG TPA: glycosyltransferase [Gemmatimonadaceae bacterium]|jgi:cellulose synthase/poly-beta-1,6-N-acetylglucosamine synthase-like glycosyltransferase/spore germination protein YaaH/peptidoglycan/xylan/chitin deacetylase (PgdA/CDA1 family)